MKITKIISVGLLLCTVLSSVALTAVSATQTADVQTEADYGLMENIQDGNILHTFCWKHTDVQAMLPQIAKAGFSAVQLSPVQPVSSNGAWWQFYQPLGFSIGSNPTGNRETLTALCTEADKYGIKIIVDVVSNHLASNHNLIQSDLRDAKYWHTLGTPSDWTDRTNVINGEVGMPDLNTSDAYVQQCVKNYLADLKSCGVDGIRFDAAKHIGLPSEGDDFWEAVTEDADLYYYGEILGNPGPGITSKKGKAILKEYAGFMSITDTSSATNIRQAFNSGRAAVAQTEFESGGISTDKIICWGESHDTYSNSAGDSELMTQNVIDRAYAVVASREGMAALYFSRPSSTNKHSIYMGNKGSTHFTSPEVAEVNRFRNAMNGQTEAYTTSGNCTVICREEGAVIVAGKGENFEVTLPNVDSLTKPGTYTDQVSGTTWTVTKTTITGKIGSTGVAVIYDPDATEEVTAVLGDTDLSGEVNIKDATQIQKHTASMITLNETALFVGDVNADKIVNIKDATAIQKFVAGTKGEFKIGEAVVVSS